MSALEALWRAVWGVDAPPAYSMAEQEHKNTVVLQCVRSLNLGPFYDTTAMRVFYDCCVQSSGIGEHPTPELLTWMFHPTHGRYEA